MIENRYNFVYKYRFVFLGIIILMMLHWTYSQISTSFYIRPYVEVYLEVKSKQGEILFKDTLINTDLFLPGYFEATHNFPLSFHFTTIGQSKALSVSLRLKKAFGKYIIIDLSQKDGTLILDKSYRFFRPVFQ